ncbi:aliphatic sulfonate ABC transporter periplasmic binding protein [Thauera humireducens]|uniref:sulfonate ABC transporter substrate-binding protein n=1 Tax=Thauera humireducens TaxID=1134435 RepID=UPI002467A234|nr:sulfonate ABC transporter substrate-binding protein [Thauera humireducens]CAH1748328.1 aliphatic sulfonate ABC transporter periplasmic binding protein [Thauera humireducens]
MSTSSSALSRRSVLKGLLAAAAAPIALSTPAALANTPEIRIGWQKGSTLSIVKARGNLEARLKAEGVKVTWTEFPAGPQMLEGLNVGSIDLGVVGETPPVFAQAAGADLVYVGNEPPAPRAEKVLVPKDSPIKSLADLKGRRVVLNKGSNVHYLLVKALESVNLKYSDVEVAFLPPADARAAFERGAVDAWVIWDPFGAAAEAQLDARILADGTGIANNYNFYIASRPFVQKHPQVLASALEAINETGEWVGRNQADAAAIVAPQIGLPVDVAAVSISRYGYGVKPLTDDVIRHQQQMADTLTGLKLIPKKLDVASVVWRPAR